MRQRVLKTDPRGLPRIQVELGGQVYEGDLQQEVRIDTDPASLNQALADNPGRFAWWATLAVLARTQAEEAENHRAVLYAELYPRFERELSSRGGSSQESPRRATNEAIKSAIFREAKYQAAVDLVTRANETQGLLEVARQAMLQRKDSLLAIASNMRAELDAHLRDKLRLVRDRIRERRRGGSDHVE